MTFRVVNLSTGEIRAELEDLKQALAHCDQLAQEGGYRESWGVVKLVTIYETKPERQEQT